MSDNGQFSCHLVFDKTAWTRYRDYNCSSDNSNLKNIEKKEERTACLTTNLWISYLQCARSTPIDRYRLPSGQSSLARFLVGCKQDLVSRALCKAMVNPQCSRSLDDFMLIAEIGKINMPIDLMLFLCAPLLDFAPPFHCDMI